MYVVLSAKMIGNNLYVFEFNKTYTVCIHNAGTLYNTHSDTQSSLFMLISTGKEKTLTSQVR